MQTSTKKLISPILLGTILVALTHPESLTAILTFLGFTDKPLIYDRQQLWILLAEHSVLVAISSIISISLAILAGIVATRKNYTYLESALSSLSSLLQTIPPVAVISIAVPLMGFGFLPTITALILYGIMPVLNNTISGLKSIDPTVKEAALGMGMTHAQILIKIELPLAWPVITAGIRTNIIINIGTATLGAVIGAGGLGVIIMAGLIRDNLAMILTGASLSAILAFFADSILELLSRQKTQKP
ncbi:ABC transporter permease [Spirochaetia bacterium 38H-sp]|uniref:ABC transporter permease n=1 Tax=Rarispira pelagica TaxID=3141764 RepID=A0ABU9UA30_9SPIR